MGCQTPLHHQHHHYYNLIQVVPEIQWTHRFSEVSFGMAFCIVIKVLAEKVVVAVLELEGIVSYKVASKSPEIVKITWIKGHKTTHFLMLCVTICFAILKNITLVGVRTILSIIEKLITTLCFASLPIVIVTHKIVCI